MAGVPVSADFAPSTCACPTCGAECKRHSVYARSIKDISIDGPAVLQVRVGKYRCHTCATIFKHELPFAGKGKRYTDRAVRKATVAVQEDKTTYTALPHRLDRDFSIKPSKSTGWAWFQSFAGSIDIEVYLRWACGRFSGQISVDSVQDGDVHMWFATDPLNKDLILGYHRAEKPDAASLTAFLTTLRDQYGISPRLFIGDDAAVFDKVPGQIWPDIPVQLCHFHVIKRLSYHYLRKSLRARFLACRPKQKRGAKPKSVQDRRERDRDHARSVEEWAETYRKRRLFLKSARSLAKPDNLERGEAKFVEEMGELHPALATFRAFVLDFYGIMDSKDAAAAELLRRAFIAKWTNEAKSDPDLKHVVDRFKNDRWFSKLFPFAGFENAHRTTNSTERANRWFRKRQKTHYRNRTEPTIRNMLHADLIYRRERSPKNEPPVILKERAAKLNCTG